MFLRFRPVYCENSALILSKRLALCEDYSGEKLQLLPTGKFISDLFSWKLLQRPSGGENKGASVRVCACHCVYCECVCARVWLSHCFLVVLHATIYVVREHVNRGGRECGCFFLCVHCFLCPLVAVDPMFHIFSSVFFFVFVFAN